jgi:phenylacetate-CoA ligase
MREAVEVSERRFWDQDIETMSPDARRRVEDARLVEQLAYEYAASPYYRSKLDAAGVRPADIRGVDDLPAVPFMEKTE